MSRNDRLQENKAIFISKLSKHSAILNKKSLNYIIHIYDVYHTMLCRTHLLFTVNKKGWNVGSFTGKRYARRFGEDYKRIN